MRNMPTFKNSAFAYQQTLQAHKSRDDVMSHHLFCLPHQGAIVTNTVTSHQSERKMTRTHLFFDPNYERVIIQRPGRPDILCNLRDEAQAELFARYKGFRLVGEWKPLNSVDRGSAWEVVPLEERRRVA